MPEPPPTPPSSSRGRFRKALGLAAVGVGILLLVLERGFFRGAGDSGSCFWIAIGSLLIILGVVELLDRVTRPPPSVGSM